MANTAVTKSFFIGETFRKAWEIFKEQWQVVLPIMAVPLVASFAYSAVDAKMGDSIGSLILWLIYFVVSMLLGMTVLDMFINISRGKKVELADFPTYWSKAMPNFVNYFMGVLMAGVIVFVGFLLLIIPGIILGLKYMFVPYLLVDKKLPAKEALTASSKMTEGVKWDLAAFAIAAMLLTWLGALAFVVGLLITVPVVTLSYALIYNTLVKRLD